MPNHAHLPPGHDPLTWASLLAHWMDLAKAARAINPAWDRAMPALITFDAITAAMQWIDHLSDEEQAYALDEASVLLEARLHDLEAMFDELPAPLSEAAHQARSSIEMARLELVWQIVWEGPEMLTMPHVSGVPASNRDGGSTALMLPGTLALPGSPIAWWTGRHEPMLEQGIAGCRAMATTHATQVWRVFNDCGEMVEDRIRIVSDQGPEGGIPLLVPHVVDGAHLELPTLPAQWPPCDRQRTSDGGVPLRWDIDPA